MNRRLHVPTRVFAHRRSKRGVTRGSLEGAPAAPAVPLDIDAVPAAFEGDDPVIVDPLPGDPGKLASYLIPGDRVALIDPGPANAAPRVASALDAHRIEVDLILLTHIHPDAAAGAGLLAGHFPQATLAAPTGATERLADSKAFAADMKKTCGERAEKLFGKPTPIEPDRIRPLEDGDTLDLGDRILEAIATPGHTAAHLAFFDPATASLFCGDALGVQLPGSDTVRPSTPPWDFSLQDSLDSIDRLARVEARSVYLARFGLGRPGPEGIMRRAARSLEAWHRSFMKKRGQTDGEEELSRQFNACVEASLEPVPPAIRRELESVSPAWLNLAGLNAEQDRLNRQLSDAA